MSALACRERAAMAKVPRLLRRATAIDGFRLVLPGKIVFLVSETALASLDVTPDELVRAVVDDLSSDARRAAVERAPVDPLAALDGLAVGGRRADLVAMWRGVTVDGWTFNAIAVAGRCAWLSARDALEELRRRLEVPA